MKAHNRTEVEWRYQIRCNQKPRNWRERLGDWLRNKAHHIDGRYSLAIEITTEPVLSERQRRECMLAGLKFMEGSLRSELVLETEEQYLKEALPRLFENA